MSTSSHSGIPRRKSLVSCAFLSVTMKQRNPKECANASRASFALCYTYSFLPFVPRSKLARASFVLSAKNEFVSSGTCWGLRTPSPRGSIKISQFCSQAAKEKRFRCVSQPESFFAFSEADAEQSPVFWTGFMR